jgi:hypothetical protein
VILVVTAVVVVLALVAGGVFVVTRDDDDTATASETSTTSTSVPDESTTTTTAADESDEGEEVDPEFAALVDELQTYVEDERGLEFKEDVEVELLADDQFVDRLLEDFDEDREELEQDALLLQSLGIIEPGTDLADALEDVVTAGVIGFYDPETDELVVRGTDTNLYVQQTIVHELVHALDDQWFDLDRPELDDAVDESSFGFGVLVEGSAHHIDQTWGDDLSEEDQEQLAVDMLRYESGMDLDFDTFPLELYEFIASQYPLGAAFVEDVLDDRGLEGVDAAFEAPPMTSKEVMEPDAYLDGFEPTPVDVPPAEGDVVDEGVFGQFLLEFVLQDEPSVDAEEVASGWAGDWYVAWEDAGSTCLRVDFATEDADAHDALAAALAEWAPSLPDAEVDEVDGDLVRLTSCVEGTAGGDATSPG